MRQIQFALGYMPHRLWGYILQAQLLEKEAGKDFYHPLEYVLNDESTRAYQRLSPMQREVVSLIDQYSDRNLHKLFARKGTVKQFQDTVTEKSIREHIRPYMEKYLVRILEIARDNRLLLFIKDKSKRNIFPEDFLKIQKSAAEPVFVFSYQDQLSYSLKLVHEHRPLVIKEAHLEIVSAFPLVLIKDDSLYFINDIDSKKLGPFLERDQVHIPPEMEQKYLASFVRNALRDFKVETEGIILQEISPVKKAELVLERGLKDEAVWILEFQYEKNRLSGDSQLKRFVNYTGEEKKPSFQWFHRDFAWEEEVTKSLREWGLSSRDEKVFYLNESFRKTPDNTIYDAINFLNEHSGFLQEAGISFRHRLKEAYFLGPVSFQMNSREEADWFDIRAKVIFGAFEFSFLKLKDHILSGSREFVLPDGRIAILPQEWFSKYRAIFEFGKFQDPVIRIHKQHFPLVENAVGAFHRETLEKLDKLKQLENLPEQHLPSGLKVELRTYQEEGFRWLSLLQYHGFGGCLADDMGLGKTLQAIAVLLRAKEQNRDSVHAKSEDLAKRADTRPEKAQLQLFEQHPEKATSLVVVPASLLHNWRSECARYAPALKTLLHAGMSRNREIKNFPCYDVVISTYHTVRQDIASFSDFRFHYVILDESQMIKNPSSKLYQSMLALKATHRLVLTGTPIENSLTDLWSQVNFVNPGLLGSLSFFKRQFVHPIEKKKDEEVEEKLKELIRPFILRRTKQEVAQELPPVYEQIRYCSMSESQRRLYEEEKSQVRNSILENLEAAGMEKSSMIVLSALTRLRQIANHPAMLEDMSEYDSGKFAEDYRDIESVLSEGHRVLVFSSFVKHLELFRDQLEKDHLPYAWLSGSSTQVQRKEAVRKFQKEASCAVFLISLKAGGTGLNLTAADYVFILDPWWNPAAELQALNRAHRIGQDKTVFVYRFISNNSIEEKIQHLQHRKKELADSFTSSNNPIKDLSEKELMELFS